MIRSILILSLLSSVLVGSSQIFGITETGDEVVLYENGTWAYVNDSLNFSKEIPLNEKVFKKDKYSSFLIKSKTFNVGVWIDPKKWKFNRSGDNEDAEYDFEMMGEDLYAILITEKIEIPIENFTEIALENARDVAPDIRLSKQEYRMVNGIKVMMIEMRGTIQGMKIIYVGYYYSNKNGTVQLITYTAQNLYGEYVENIEKFLNGFVEIEE
jgi:hypothetical protein